MSFSSTSATAFADFWAPPPSTRTYTEETIQVLPKVPTIAGETKVYPLVGSDLALLASVQNAHVIPALIDGARFAIALSKTLALFPTFCGNLRHGTDSGNWWIALNNSAIPLTIEHACKTPIPEDWVLAGTHLSPFIEPVKLANLENTAEPMVAFKLSYFPAQGSTIIGVMISHVLADAFRAKEFTLLLSDNYQGLTLTLIPSFTVPVPAQAPLSSLSLGVLASTDRRFENTSCLVRDAYKLLLDSFRETSLLSLRMSGPQVFKLRKRVAIELGDKLEGIHLSGQDVITALLVASMNRHLSVRIDHIVTLWNFRSVANLANYGGNGTAQTITKVLSVEEQTNIALIAIALRRSIIEARDPETFTATLPAIQARALDFANTGTMRRFALPPGRALMNSVSGFDWNAAHFGFPGLVQFHTAFIANRYCRTFRSNPLILDGVVKDERAGSVDVHCMVDSEIHERVMETLRAQLDA